MDLLELSRVNREILRDFPSFRVKKKSDSRLMRVISWLLFIISFGRLRTFNSFATTIGTTVYVPDFWEDLEPLTRCVTLRHEAVHMRQARRYGRFWFSFLYLFVVLPGFLAYFRAKFEKEAYEESLRAYHAYGIDITTTHMQDVIVYHFTSAEYLWMWPFKRSIKQWVMRAVATITGGHCEQSNA